MRELKVRIHHAPAMNMLMTAPVLHDLRQI